MYHKQEIKKFNPTFSASCGGKLTAVVVFTLPSKRYLLQKNCAKQGNVRIVCTFKWYLTSKRKF